MTRTLTNIPVNHQQYFFVFVALVFVLLASCPIKGTIKALAGLPIKTEQGLTKGGPGLIGNSPERCVNVGTSYAKIPQNLSNANDLLPVVILTATFLFLIGFSHWKNPSYKHYGNLKIPSTLPIYLQYRRLII